MTDEHTESDCRVLQLAELGDTGAQRSVRNPIHSTPHAHPAAAQAANDICGLTP